MNPVDDTETIERMLAAGWIVRDGNGFNITAIGKAAIRRGRPGKQFGPTSPVDSTRARSRTPIRKKKPGGTKRA